MTPSVIGHANIWVRWNLVNEETLARVADEGRARHEARKQEVEAHKDAAYVENMRLQAEQQELRLLTHTTL